MTPAVKLLERTGITHRTISYAHDLGADSYGSEAAEALGVGEDLVFKTLIATLDDGRHVVGVVPVSALLDLKALAGAAGAKKAKMADQAVAERVTGYVLGGISPIGQKKRLDIFIDASAGPLDLLYVSGGRRGLEIELSPADLLAATGATLASIADR